MKEGKFPYISKSCESRIIFALTAICLVGGEIYLVYAQFEPAITSFGGGRRQEKKITLL